MKDNKITVVISGLLYPMTMLHWFWKSLERREDVDLFVVGPFFGNWIPWNYGMTVPENRVKQPNLALPKEMARTLLHPEMLRGQVPEEVDLWLQVDAGWHLSSRPRAKIVAHVQTDPHVLKGNYNLPKSYSDFNFCMQKCYMQEGEIYLPYGYDPTIYYPTEVEKEFDACLIGLHYPQRDMLVSNLRNRDYTVQYSIGEIFEDNAELYNKSRVALSWSTLQDLPARVWEGMGLGLPVLTNRVPDLDNFFVEGLDYLGFTTLPEAVEKFVWAMNNYDKALEIAHSAHKKVKAEHTWDHRVQTILETVGLV